MLFFHESRGSGSCRSNLIRLFTPSVKVNYQLLLPVKILEIDWNFKKICLKKHAPVLNVRTLFGAYIDFLSAETTRKAIISFGLYFRIKAALFYISGIKPKFC